MANSPSGGDKCRALLCAALLCALSSAPLAQANNAAALTVRHAQLREQLATNQFQRPLYLESSDISGRLQGDIYAVVEQSYAVVGPALQDREHWCDILILHQNVKSCRASSSRVGDVLSLNIGRKYDQPLADAYPIEFAYKVMSAEPGYLRVELHAEKGPLGTSGYSTVLEVVALEADLSFLHMSYSYGYGMVARTAMYGYFATIGRNKVGFSIIDTGVDGQPVYLAGMLGLVERNTMRYYLAIDAYLGALLVPAPERLEKSLSDWYGSIERYPRQLHELARDEYLDMKRREIQRQRAPRGDQVVD